MIYGINDLWNYGMIIGRKESDERIKRILKYY